MSLPHTHTDICYLQSAPLCFNVFVLNEYRYELKKKNKINRNNEINTNWIFPILAAPLSGINHTYTYTYTHTQYQCQTLYSKLLKLTQSHQNRLLSHQHYPEHLLKVNEIELILLQIMYSWNYILLFRDAPLIHMYDHTKCTFSLNAADKLFSGGSENIIDCPISFF